MVSGARYISLDMVSDYAVISLFDYTYEECLVRDAMRLRRNGSHSCVIALLEGEEFTMHVLRGGVLVGDMYPAIYIAVGLTLGCYEATRGEDV